MFFNTASRRRVVPALVRPVNVIVVVGGGRRDGLQKGRSHQGPVAQHPADPDVRAVYIRILRRLLRAERAAPESVQLGHNARRVRAVRVHRHVHGDPVPRLGPAGRGSGHHALFRPLNDQVHVLQHRHQVVLPDVGQLEQHVTASPVRRVALQVGETNSVRLDFLI